MAAARGGGGSRWAPLKKKKKSGPSVKREDSSTAGDPLAALQQQLTRQLAATVEETVGAVCGDFARELRRPAMTGSVTAATASTADYDLYYSCCKRLVTYIAANMTTSPDFAAQMERIILACHSKASERVLRTVATKNVWFHRRDGGDKGDDEKEDEEEGEEEEDEEEEEEEEEEPARRSTRAAPPKSPKKSPARTIKKEKASPARPTRSPAKKSVQPPAPTRTTSKRQAPVKSEPPPAKRMRPTRRRSLPLPKFGDDDEEEEEEEEEIIEEEEHQAGSNDVDDAEDDNKDDDGQDNEAAPNQPHYDGSDELLDFNDPVREMCYVDKRTPAQTKFFKERLRKAILFVDAQLCKPPPGKVCGSDCKKIRAVMCDRNLPCRNKICRVWHDVEVHIDRCQNTHCELKNRVMLRETMHKIDHKKLEIQQTKGEVAAKKKQREEIKGEEANEREQFIELTLLSNEIEQLESDIAAAEEELGILNGTKKAFWACLNVVGIELKDDVADGFPDLATHYVSKKQPSVKLRAPKRAAKDLEKLVPEQQQQQSDQRRDSGDVNGSETGVNDVAPGGAPSNSMAPITRRTTRRSTAKSFQVMSMEAVSAESEEESKSVEADDQGSVENSGNEDRGATSATSNFHMTDAVEESQENSIKSRTDREAAAAEITSSTEKIDDSAKESDTQELAMTQTLVELLPDTEADATAPAASQTAVTKERVEVTTTSTLSTATTQSQSQVVVTAVRVEEVTTAVTTMAATAAPESPQISNIQILPSIGP